MPAGVPSRTTPNQKKQGVLRRCRPEFDEIGGLAMEGGGETRCGRDREDLRVGRFGDGAEVPGRTQTVDPGEGGRKNFLHVEKKQGGEVARTGWKVSRTSTWKRQTTKPGGKVKVKELLTKES